MYIIGENIHIISDSVKEALKNRDARFFQELAVEQVEAGADALSVEKKNDILFAFSQGRDMYCKCINPV